jgi:hypothetical protein
MRNKYQLGIVLAFFGILAGSAFGQAAQTQAPAGQSQSPWGNLLGQGKGLFGGGKAGVTVQMIDAVDSNAGGAGRTFRATVQAATNVGGVAIPQGAPAVTVLQQAGNGWTLALTAIVANGQPVSVTSNFASTKGGKLAALMNGGGGLPWGQKQPKGQTVATNTPATPAVSASGARVYLPASTTVSFMVTPKNPVSSTTNANNTVPAGQPQAAQPVATNTAGVAAGIPMTTGGNAPQIAPMNMQQNAGPQSAGTNGTVIFKGIQYQLARCHREAPHIVCELQVMNIGSADTVLRGDPRTYFIDQNGNRGGVKSGTVANCNLGACEMLPQLPMKAREVFDDETGESRTFVRFQLWAGGEQVAQFQNVAIQ